MKLLFNIAKNEFRHLFYAPIAWFLLIVFLVQCAIFYTIPVFDTALVQDMALRNNPRPRLMLDPESLTRDIFLKGGIFAYAIGNLYLFVPLLTMGLISREVNNGTIKLLYSSPVQLRQIVLGKYLGIMLFNLLLIAIVGIFMITGAFNILHVDYGILLSATLGFYLIVCTYSAIGLFMSSLSTYQIVSALASFTIIFILGRIDGLWQKYDVVRDLTYFLSLQNRTGKMLAGLITSKDVIYFIAVSGMFTAFTLIKLRNGREAKPWLVRTGRYVAVFAVTLLIGYISSRPQLTGYWDTSATQRNTIHPRTQQNIRALGDSTLEVTLYTNLIDQNAMAGMPEMRNRLYMSGFWEAYLRFKPDILFRYEYYYDVDDNDSTVYKWMPGKNLQQIAAEMADGLEVDTAMFKTPAEMRSEIDLKDEAYRLVMKLTYKGRSVFLRTYQDGFIWPDEQNMNAALRQLLQAGTPKILFVTGQLERSLFKTGEREYAGTKMIQGRRALVNVGFDVDTINLATQHIPPGIAALALLDPKMELAPVVMDKLKSYVAEGGNMLIMGEPGKQYVLNPFLRHIGIRLMEGQLVQPSYDETPEKVKPYLTWANESLAEELPMLALKKMKETGITSDSMHTLMPGAAAIDYTTDSGFAVEPLAMTSPGRAWVKMGELVTDSTLPPLNTREGDFQLPTFATLVKATRTVNGKEQRIIVSGDADFLSNRRYSASFFGNALYSWLDYNRYPVYTPRPPARDTRLVINATNAGLQKTFFLWVLPGILLLSGMVLLTRRKRK